MADALDEDDPKEYRWESGYEKTWEAITEDASGRIEASVQELVLRNKRKRQQSRRDAGVRLGIMRHVYLILDASQAMAVQDLKPTRLLCVAKILEQFVPEFHEQNPISQLGLITTHNKMAAKFSDLSNNPNKLLDKLPQLRELHCRGEPSIQNALELAVSSLCHLPAHTSREVVLLYGALTTTDPGEISTTLAKVQAHNIRVSVIGLAAEMHICRAVAEASGGSAGVSMTDAHLCELVKEHLDPPPASERLQHTLIKVGFPHEVSSGVAPALCMCHPSHDTPATRDLSTRGYYCPQCSAKYCSLPAECRVCGLMLVTAPHLARSYRHLFPLAMFTEVVRPADVSSCYGCCRSLDAAADAKMFQCPSCLQLVCCDCDMFLHESLHTCPGCASRQ